MPCLEIAEGGREWASRKSARLTPCTGLSTPTVQSSRNNREIRPLNHTPRNPPPPLRRLPDLGAHRKTTPPPSHRQRHKRIPLTSPTPHPPIPLLPLALHPPHPRLPHAHPPPNLPTTQHPPPIPTPPHTTLPAPHAPQHSSTG